MIDTEEGLKEYYEQLAEMTDYADLGEANYWLERRRTEIIMDLLALRSATSVLDIGCGEGLQLEWFQKSFPALRLTGIDVSERRIERAKQRVPSANLIVRSGTGPGLGFAAGSFDRAFCSEVLEHLPQPEQVLANAYDVLRPGGLLVVSVPYAQKLVRVICMHCGKITTDAHVNSFDEAKIAGMLREAGFAVLSARGYKMVVFPLVRGRLPYVWWKRLQKPFGWYFRGMRPYYLIALARK